MIPVSSFHDLMVKSSGQEKTYLLLFKPESDQSRCAFQQLEKAIQQIKFPVFSADVSQVRDIHPRFGINSVPAMVIFSGGHYENTIMGCHEATYYKAILENSVFRAETRSAPGNAKQVTVYSTPSCSWCNTLKSWLQKNNIRYSDIDISRDQKAAEDLVRRSGQQGVPQTDVNGQIVVGFNQPLLKELLEIQ
jgi:glutaredoxin-like YruB-family protein